MGTKGSLSQSLTHCDKFKVYGSIHSPLIKENFAELLPSNFKQLTTSQVKESNEEIPTNIFVGTSTLFFGG